MEVIIHLDDNINHALAANNYIHANTLKNIENNACTSIDLTNSLEFTEDPDSLIKLAIQKLRSNGIILIHGHDLYEISRTITTLELDPRKACALIYQGRKMLFGAYEIKKMLKSIGVEKVNIQVDGPIYKIEGQYSADTV